MNNHVVRGNTMSRDIRKEGRADDSFIVQMPNIGYNHLENGVFVGVFRDNLAEVWADVQEVFDVKIIFVSTTDECTAGISGFQCEVVDTDVLNQFGPLLAVRGQ